MKSARRFSTTFNVMAFAILASGFIGTMAELYAADQPILIVSAGQSADGVTDPELASVSWA